MPTPMDDAAQAAAERAKRLFTGRWDRIATFGKKVQVHPDPTPEEPDRVFRQEFDFTADTFREWVENFDRLYKGRHLPYDFEHQAVDGSQNRQPVQALAWASGLCAIESGKVYAFYCQDPVVQAPDPAELLRQIQERYPSDPDADGCWAYRSEVSPLGIRYLPNCEQLSPFFDDENKDEAAVPIGSRAMTISVVCIAHQDRTVLNLPPEARLAALSAAHHSPGALALAAALGRRRQPRGSALGHGAQRMDMPGSAEHTPAAMSDEEYMGKLAKFGYAAGGSPEDEDKALAAYAMETEDAPAMRKAMAACRAARLGKAGLGNPPPAPGPGAGGDKDKDGSAAFAAAMTRRLTSTEQELAAIKADQVKNRKAAFTALATQGDSLKGEPPRCKTAADADAILADCGGNVEAAERTLRRLPPLLPTGLSQTRFPPSSAASTALSGSGAWSQVGRTLVKGAALSAAAAKIEKEKKIPYDEAQREALRQDPSLYE